MSFDWKALLGTVAPVLATAVGGPLGGIAAKAISEALGLSEQTEEAISTALAGAKPEDLLKLKEADQKFRRDMKALDVDLAKLEQADRQSARELTITGKARTPALLSWIVVVGTFVMYGWLVRFGNPLELDDVILGRILGTLDTAFGIVLAYWLGTSFSSKQKDETIKSMAA
jgi:hypothetical protein